MGNRLSKVRGIFRRGRVVPSAQDGAESGLQNNISNLGQPTYPTAQIALGPPISRPAGHGNSNQCDLNQDERSDTSLDMRIIDHTESEQQEAISAIPSQPSYPNAQSADGPINHTAGQSNSNQCHLNQPIWKDERQCTSLDMRVMDLTEGELQEAVSTIPGQPSAQLQQSAPGPVSLSAQHLHPTNNSKKCSETSSGSALVDQSSDQDDLKQQVEKNKKLYCIESELEEAISGQYLYPSAQVQQNASRPESLLADHLDPTNNLEKISETSSTIAWESQSNSSQDDMNLAIKKGELPDTLLDMKAMGHTESEMEETTIPGQPSHPSTQKPSSATGRESLHIENADPSNNSVKSSETLSISSWDTQSNSSQDDLNQLQHTENERNKSSQDDVTRAIEKGEQSDTLLDIKTMGHTESEMEETTIPGQPSHSSTQIPSSTTGRESFHVENVHPSNNSLKSSETSSIGSWDSYSSIDKNDLNQSLEEDESDILLNMLAKDHIESKNIFSKLMPKQYEKDTREKVNSILERWDASGKLAEIEASVDGISHCALTIPGLVSALKQVEQCHLKSIEDHIALAYRVYCWVAKNISYTFHVNETNPSVILKTKQAVCSGYASLFLKLANEVGLSVIRVDGNTRKCLHPETVFLPQESNSHTWNMVCISVFYHVVKWNLHSFNE